MAFEVAPGTPYLLFLSVKSSSITWSSSIRVSKRTKRRGGGLLTMVGNLTSTMVNKGVNSYHHPQPSPLSHRCHGTHSIQRRASHRSPTHAEEPGHIESYCCPF